MIGTLQTATRKQALGLRLAWHWLSDLTGGWANVRWSMHPRIRLATWTHVLAQTHAKTMIPLLRWSYPSGQPSGCLNLWMIANLALLQLTLAHSASAPPQIRCLRSNFEKVCDGILWLILASIYASMKSANLLGPKPKSRILAWGIYPKIAKIEILIFLRMMLRARYPMKVMLAFPAQPAASKGLGFWESLGRLSRLTMWILCYA